MKVFIRITSVIILSMMIFNIMSQAQTPDTVCAGQAGVPYSVTSSAGSTYNWIVSGGTQAGGTNTNAITINWGNTAGLYSLKVVETSAAGCIGDTVALNVRILPLPTAALSGTTSICYSDATPQLSVSFTGVGPWTFTYTNGSSNATVSNVSSSPYVFTPGLAPTIPSPGTSPATTTYSLVSVSGSNSCSGSVSGTAAITVNPKPVTSAIAH